MADLVLQKWRRSSVYWRNDIPDHPDIAAAEATGYPREYKYKQRCVDEDAAYEEYRWDRDHLG